MPDREQTLAEWFEAADEAATSHTRALTYSPAERLYHKLTGLWPQSVVVRRMEALARDEAAHRRFLAENPVPKS